MRSLLEWSRRHADGAHPGNAVDDLACGMDTDTVRRRRGLPAAALDGVRSYYELIEGGVYVCDGTSCHFAGGPALAEELRPRGDVRVVRCLGFCYDPPGIRVGDAVVGAARRVPQEAPDLLLTAGSPPPHRRALDGPAVVLRNVVEGASPDPAREYDLPDGDTILRRVEASGLCGRGGAAYPTGAKWRTAKETPAEARWVVVNGDEGDPGSFVDRVLLEEDPHAILAGVMACARAIDARHAVVFVRGEYPRAHATMVEAVAEARGSGWLDPDLDVRVAMGAGSYVCGEESALLRSIEGLRGEPSPRPPYPAQAGLYGLPTVVQNVETMAQIPWLVREGHAARTKVVSIAGAVRRPGLVEVPLGTSLRRVLEAGAEGPVEGRRWKMAMVGGPMGRVLREARFDAPLDYDALPGLGHAGVVVLDDTVSVRALAQHLFDFAAAESCGTCTPCRVGTTLLARAPDPAALERILDTLEIGSLCGFGQGVPRPLRDLLADFREEFFR